MGRWGDGEMGRQRTDGELKMVTIVVVLNFSIALICLAMAWQMGKVRKQLARVTKALILAERNTHNVLHPAPHIILKGQKGANWLTNQYQQRPAIFQAIERILLGLTVAQKIRQSKWPQTKLRKNFF
ncbi:MAG: hypothetical protein KME17_23190 [Cyanosarcina radialis HA8281-LM2]|jgi:hypothetical protein|nr:hypothetical protein [Cyanosarcina radialis HA8281-LM2]